MLCSYSVRYSTFIILLTSIVSRDHHFFKYNSKYICPFSATSLQLLYPTPFSTANLSCNFSMHGAYRSSVIMFILQLWYSIRAVTKHTSVGLMYETKRGPVPPLVAVSTDIACSMT